MSCPRPLRSGAGLWRPSCRRVARRDGARRAVSGGCLGANGQGEGRAAKAKSEGRRPKSEGNPKSEIRTRSLIRRGRYAARKSLWPQYSVRGRCPKAWRFRPLEFGFPSDFGFRPFGLGFVVPKSQPKRPRPTACPGVWTFCTPTACGHISPECSCCFFVTPKGGLATAPIQWGTGLQVAGRPSVVQCSFAPKAGEYIVSTSPAAMRPAGHFSSPRV